jgi:hypothetical protein
MANSGQQSFWLRALEVVVLVVMEAAVWTVFGDLPRWFLYATIVLGAMVIFALELKGKQGRAYRSRLGRLVRCTSLCSLTQLSRQS